MEYGGYTLDPFQEQAIRAVERGQSVLVAAPTGAGKTLIAEYAIDRAMQAGRQIVYTAPIKALSNQKFRDFSARYGDRIGILTGDVSIHYDAPGLIMTTEIFRNTLLEDPDRVANVDFVIFDEFHFINDRERGTVWEESVIFAPEPIRFICLSATMPNTEELARWVEAASGDPVEVVVETNRPVPLDHQLWVDGYGLHSLEDFDELTTRLARGERPRRVPHLGCEALLDHVVKHNRLPCLYFCFNRRLCEVRAEQSARRDLLGADEARQVARMFQQLCERFDVTHEPSAVRMGDLVRRGVAFHHAGILPTLKEVVERLFTSGLIKMLFCTETFALGVNMPAQTVCLDSVEKFHGTHFGYLRARDYQQMAGRAGRRGMDTQGYVHARLDIDEVTYHGVEHVVAGRPERVESQFDLGYAPILSLYGRWQERLYQVCDRSLAAFQQHRRRRRSGKPRRKKKKRKGKGRGREERPGLRKLLRRRIKVLRALGYLGKKGPTAKGRFALHIPGYELPTTELHEAGILEDLTPHELNVLLSALVYEAKPGHRGHIPKSLLGRVRRRAIRTVKNIYRTERQAGIPDPVPKVDLHLGVAVNAWSRGADFADLASYTDAAEGDIIRTLRMTIQILRQLRKATRSEAFQDKLLQAERCINRGPVDAERQLRAGCDVPIDPDDGEPEDTACTS